LHSSEIGVTAHARLHLGFLDLEGSLGRRFASLGVAIATPVTRLRLSRSPSLIVEGQEQERARRYLLALAGASGRPQAYRLVVEEAIPAHAGLGSGTQLALAIGAAYGLLEGRVMPPAQMGAQLERGARSGVSIGTFQNGGLVVDGGRAEGGGVPPTIVALPMPASWRVILLFDKSLQGVHGQNELDAFNNLPPFSAEQSAYLCRLTLMQALPALAEGDLKGFGNAVEVIQQTMGTYFAAAQGGGAYASPRVAAALGWLKVQGATGLGQSSWGPTGFAFVKNASEGQALTQGLQKAGLLEGLSVQLTEFHNKGADIAVLQEHTNGQEMSADEDIAHGGKTHA
jgi:beta-ribofuranosylaminobenzene 5'-phosphate synthase